jgi:hypothetical protein
MIQERSSKCPASAPLHIKLFNIYSEPISPSEARVPAYVLTVLVGVTVLRQ